MYSQEIFSWAEDKNGKMVYVDDVPGGASCGCICPSCRENVIARHGNERAHGFAHESKKRGANLNMCLKVITFKLAEQIIATEKRICLPSYYGIFRSKKISFEKVEINDSFEREDRQPDILATTEDNQKYLIEFCFEDDVRRKQKIDYIGLNCLEINLSGQKINNRDSLRDFLLNREDDRKWLNNDIYFNSIYEIYKSKGKDVRLVEKEKCIQCPLRYSCCAVVNPNEGNYLQIKQNDKTYLLCKLKEYTQKMADYNQQQEEIQRCREKNFRTYHEPVENREGLFYEERHVLSPRQIVRKQMIQHNNVSEMNETVSSDEISCLNCTKYVGLRNKDGRGHCGCYQSLGISRKTNPDHAKVCHYFERKKDTV